MTQPHASILERAAAVRQPGRVRPLFAQGGPQEQFLMSPADLIVFGGSAFGGKSFGLLLDAARFVHVSGYRAVIFRRTSVQLKMPGQLFDQATEIYARMGARVREAPSMDFTFPSGAVIRLSHMEHEKNRFDWDGSQASYWGFDEAQHFEESQFWYVALSRARSSTGLRPMVRATCMPDPDCFLASLISWWWDAETGYPIPEHSGVLRWFRRVDDRLYWYGTRLEANEDTSLPPDTGKAMSLTFIASKLEDNEIGVRLNPDYESRLNALPYVERERLRKGNWLVRPTAGRIFKRSWWVDRETGIERIVDDYPKTECEEIRYWDKAGTADDDTAYSARTAGVRMARHEATGRFYIVHVLADHLEDIEREKVIRQIAAIDGYEVPVYHEQEPGSGGKDSARATTRNLAGYDVHGEKVTGSKVSRWRGYAAQCEAGNVFLLRGAWNEEFLAEHQAADGTKRVRCDIVDAASGAFNKLVTRSGKILSLKG